MDAGRRSGTAGVAAMSSGDRLYGSDYRGNHTEIRIESFAANAEFACQIRLASSRRKSLLELQKLLLVQGGPSSSIFALGLRYRDPFFLALENQGPLELGHRAQKRQEQDSHGGVVAGNPSCRLANRTHTHPNLINSFGSNCGSKLQLYLISPVGAGHSRLLRSSGICRRFPPLARCSPTA